MVFIGLIADKSEYSYIESIFFNEHNNKKFKFFHITEQNIENFQNIKFDTVIIMKKLDKLSNEITALTKVFKQINYLLCNTDIPNEIEIEDKIHTKIITYGFNSKATIVISSVGEEKLLVDVQRDLVLNDGKTLESGEHILKYKKPHNPYEEIVIFILNLIYY